MTDTFSTISVIVTQENFHGWRQLARQIPASLYWMGSSTG
jgi:hypothetical protein